MRVSLAGVTRAATFLVIAALYVGVGVFDHEVWAPVEPTVVGVVWEMVDSGDVLLPRINGTPFVEKPPLYYWLAVGVSRAAGSLDAWVVRLPAALLGVACLAIFYAVARREFGERAAQAAALLGATHVLFWHASHWAASDIAALFFCFLCFGLFARSLDPDAGSRGRRRLDAALCLGLAVSFYAKNLFVPFVVIPPVVVTLLLRREPRRAARIVLVSGTLLVAVAIPWLVVLYREGGELMLKLVLFDNTFARLLHITSVAPSLAGLGNFNDAFIAEDEPFYYYLLLLPVYTAPWVGVFAAAVVGVVRKRRHLGELQRFAAVGLVTLPIVLSLSRSKSLDYLVPVSFFVFLLLADLLSDLFRGRRVLAPGEQVLVRLNLAIAAVFALIFPIVLAASGAPLLLLLLVPLLPFVVWLWGRLRSGVNGERVWEFAWAGAVVATIALGAGLPRLDPWKSYRPFFDDVERYREGRQIVTTFDGVNRLPLITYYLRSRVEVVSDSEVALERLRGAEPVGAVIRREECAEHSEELAAIPGVLVTDARGRGRLCFAANQL